MCGVCWFIIEVISLLFPPVAIAWIFYLDRVNRSLERRLSSLEDRNSLDPWINIEKRSPVDHGYYEVMTEEGFPRHLVTKTIRFDGNVGGIKFWRMIRVGGK